MADSPIPHRTTRIIPGVNTGRVLRTVESVTVHYTDGTTATFQSGIDTDTDIIHIAGEGSTRIRDAHKARWRDHELRWTTDKVRVE